MSVYIIQGKKNLLKVLKKIESNTRQTCFILLDGDNDEGSLLKNHSVEELSLQNLDKSSQEVFLREYRDLIGLISCECNSREWWATDMASKNRSASRLPFLLHEFLSIIKSISETKGKELMVVNPSWVLIGSIEIYLLKEKLEYNIYPDHFKKWREIIIMKIRMVARISYILTKVGIRKLFSYMILRKKMEELSKKKNYYIIKTFLYDHSFDLKGNYKDIFFGKLPDYLQEEENPIILADVLGNWKNNVKLISKCRSHLIVPLEMFLTVKDSLTAAIEVMAITIRINKKYFFAGHDVSEIINRELARTANGIPFYQYLHYFIIRSVLGFIHAKVFLLTYENNPWEKMCMMAMREESPNTRIIGYQHSVVPQASVNAFISHNEKDIIPIPDRIFTVGKIPKDIMERYGSYETGKIEPACGLRYEYLFNTLESERRKNGNILLALEGLHGTHMLVNYALEELGGNKNYHIRIRTHPELPLDSFKKKLTHDLRNVQNFKLTDNVFLKADLEWADIVMYWGSTVSLEALIMGIPLIRYNMDTVLNYDPLFECRHLKWIVNEDSKLAEVIEEIYSLDDQCFDEEKEKARKYLTNYFYPVTEERLKLFLPEERRRTVNGLS